MVQMAHKWGWSKILAWSSKTALANLKLGCSSKGNLVLLPILPDTRTLYTTSCRGLWLCWCVLEEMWSLVIVLFAWTAWACKGCGCFQTIFCFLWVFKFQFVICLSLPTDILVQNHIFYCPRVHLSDCISLNVRSDAEICVSRLRDELLVNVAQHAGWLRGKCGKCRGDVSEVSTCMAF